MVNALNENWKRRYNIHDQCFKVDILQDRGNNRVFFWKETERNFILLYFILLSKKKKIFSIHLKGKWKAEKRKVLQKDSNNFNNFSIF